MMQIDLLYFDDCPSWQVGFQNLEAALAQEGIEASIRLVKVTDNDQAGHLRFLGSPSFQVDGVDLWPEERSLYSMSCRVYATPHGLSGAPDVDMLRSKLRTHLRNF